LASLADPLNPGFGFDLIRLEATETAPFDEDERGMPDLDAGARTRANMAAAFSELVDALGARLDPERVRLPIAVDSHVPERATILAPARAALAIAAPETLPASFRLPGAPPSRPLRLFDPPEPIEALAEVPDGPPARFRWRRAMHQVARAEGPERIAPEWWIGDDPAATRDYFRVEDAAGRRFWLYREGLYGHQDLAPRWFMHGLFA
jgi:protein ImuB